MGVRTGASGSSCTNCFRSFLYSGEEIVFSKLILILFNIPKDFSDCHSVRTSPTCRRKYFAFSGGITAFFVALETMTSSDLVNKNGVIVSECRWMTFHQKFEQYRG